MNEALGGENFGPIVQEHLRVGTHLARLAGGTIVKTIGDALMITFEHLEGAVRFAAELQQFYMVRSPTEDPALQVRIGMYLGPVEPVNGDVFGTGVNAASRIEGVAEPEFVLVNKEFANSLAAAWGQGRVDLYFRSAGTFDLKGLTPSTQQLLNFDWQAYCRDSPGRTLADRVYAHLGKGGIEALDVSADDLGRPCRVIWPVVPRRLVTAIHRAQVEVIRLLVRLGWRVVVLIADCGAAKSPSPDQSREFRDQVVAYMRARAIVPDECLFMNEMYSTSNQSYSALHNHFRAITSELSLNDYLRIIRKEYSGEIILQLDQSKTLDTLRPVLTCGAVLHLAEQSGGRCIVVAGRDERFQWNRTRDLGDMRKHIGALLIPALEMGAYQTRQTNDWPIWYSEQDLEDAMKDGSNLASWLFKLLAFVPAFPAPTAEVPVGHHVAPEEWPDKQLPNAVTSRDVATAVWPLVRPR